MPPSRSRPEWPGATGKPARSFGHHNVGGLDDGNSLVADGEAEIVDRLVGDRRGDDHAVADLDPDMRRRRAPPDFDDPALELIAGADLHGRSPSLCLDRHNASVPGTLPRRKPKI